MRWLPFTLTCLALAGCGQNAPSTANATELTVWAHAGQASERRVIEHQVQAFNRLHPDIHVRLTFIPERTYNAQVQATAVAGKLPDLLEFDAPYLASYAWQGRLLPMEKLLPRNLQQELLPSIIRQGSYRGHLYGIGTFDSGLALYGRKSLLEKAGARIPAHPGEAWSVAEFEQILTRLAKHDADGAVLDLKLNYPDEWFTYAFSPLLVSAGGDLVSRDGEPHAEGILNGPASVAAMTHLQHWLRDGLVDPNVDDAAFVAGRVALSWAGHWEYPRYHAAFGDDLLLLPLPNFGHGSRTDQGSWMWGITRHARAPAKAALLIEYLLQPDQILAMTSANGAVPATRTAIRRSPLYRPGGALQLFVEQLNDGYSVPRPQTPAYPVISASFRQAFADIRNGTPVQQALNRAAKLIDREIRDNHGYPPVTGP